MSTTPSRIGSYPIEREIGRGGMGIVYLGRDPRLDRPVAIKVLPDEFASDPERLARFEREARLLASLSHPNIAGIYGLEEEAGRRFLALEYVEGETLAERLGRGPLPSDEALETCRQIAGALEAAHESGVIHRDLKPGNVKLTPAGEVKVLDFGLAKGVASAGAESSSDPSQSPTLTYAATGVGVILGTAAYLSPEQARGRPVDRRTDIWAFGCVVYECLTGRKAFEGDTVSDTLAAILQGAPEWAAIPAGIPSRISELIHRCLEKDPRRRLRDIGDARLEIEQALAERSRAAEVAARHRPRPSAATLGLAAGLLVAGATLGFLAWSTLGPGRGAPGSPSRGEVARFSIPVPPELQVSHAALSPDGRTIAVRARPREKQGSEDPQWQMFVRRLDRYELEPIKGTEEVQGCFYSPDGRWLAFVAPLARGTTQRKLAKVPVDGSAPPVTLSNWDDGWGAFAWTRAGDLLVMTDAQTGYVRVPSAGGAPGAPVKLDAGDFAGGFSFSEVLPGDRHALLNAFSWGSRGYQIGVALVDLETGKTRILFEQGGNAEYSPTGHIVFSRGEALLAAPFDLHQLEVRGEPVALLDGLRTTNVWSHGGFQLANDGTLFYSPGGLAGSRRQLVIVDPAGRTKPWSEERRAYEIVPSLSPDGRRVAVVVTNARGVYETWVGDLDRPGLRRLAAVEDADCALAVWSPDGRRIAFQREGRNELDGIYVMPADGRSAPVRILQRGDLKNQFAPTGWAPDGSSLLVERLSEGKSDVLLLAVPRQRDTLATPHALAAGSFNEREATFSPDAQWLAYVSDETGKNEVFVCALLPDGTTGPGLQVSRGGGSRPRWTVGGRQIVYVTDPPKIMGVTVSTSPSLTASPPRELHDLDRLRVEPFAFDALPDGRLLVIQKGEEEDEITRLNLVQGFSTELRTRLTRTRKR